MAKPSGAICNLDCTYCFFLSKEMLYPGDRFRMADQTLENYVRQTLEAHGPGEVVLAFQGGEPTLMESRSSNAPWSTSRHARPSQTPLLTLQTNGVLLDDRWRSSPSTTCSSGCRSTVRATSTTSTGSTRQAGAPSTGCWRATRRSDATGWM
ncbi:MAG: hypothetical protein R2789_02525 [Microthrixaceae bacterium]